MVEHSSTTKAIWLSELVKHLRMVYRNVKTLRIRKKVDQLVKLTNLLGKACT